MQLPAEPGFVLRSPPSLSPVVRDTGAEGLALVALDPLHDTLAAAPILATLPFTLALADKGHRRALAEDPHLKQGLNVAGGKVTYKAVAEAHGLPYMAPEEALAL